jgi:hypothetical protein
MKRLIVPVLLLAVFCGCNSSDAPDVSSIKAPVNVVRFDKDFFAIDSNRVAESLPALQQKYPSFLPLFVLHVLGASDSAGKYDMALVKRYLHVSKPVYDSVALHYPTLSPQQAELEKAFKYVKYYYPSYRIPAVVTTVGPIDAMAKMENGDYSPNFMGPDFIAISLQFYLGKNFPVYQDQYFIDNVAPFYRSRRFEKEYIVSDVMKLVADDIYPDKSAGQPLIVQMVEKGKQWLLMDKLLPFAADSAKTGYTQAQLKWCNDNESMIWNAIIKGADVFTTDPAVVQMYIGEGPKTDGMPDSSPGNIGQWIGWQIVKEFARKNSSLTLQQILKTEPRKIFEESKYKPK